MATKNDIDFTYTTLDKIFRLSLGDTADFSGARYNGNFSMALEEAQEAKHRYMAEQCHIGANSRVLDIGSGWGPFLQYARKQGAIPTGVTLSDGQLQACRQQGLDVHIRDARQLEPTDIGTYDAVVSVGAFEHFCSYEEYQNGKQEQIYRDFFEKVSRLLPSKGRFYLQTMTWGKLMWPGRVIDENAEPGSDDFLVKLLMEHFPGSWLPYGEEMIVKNAAPWFELVRSDSGRLDYIETTKQWRRRIRRFSWKKYLLFLQLVPHFIFTKTFRIKMQVFRHRANQQCFEREIMDHYRIVFEKR